MQLIAITGGIATGKSTTSAYLKEKLSAPLIDADVISRMALKKGTAGYRKTVKVFPSIVDEESGDINRMKLASLVFGIDPECQRRRKILEGIVHPIVRRKMFLSACKYWFLGYERCLLDIPLLIESRLYRWMSVNVLVWSAPTIQIERMMLRNAYTSKEANDRIKSQLPLVDKLSHCQVLIRNEGDLSMLKRQIRQKIVNNPRFTPSFWWHRVVLHALPLLLGFSTLIMMIKIIIIKEQ